MLAMGQGITPVRAALNWTPVQAHATARKVTCYYVCSSAAQAAFLTEWDAWRDAGVSCSAALQLAVQPPVMD